MARITADMKAFSHHGSSVYRDRVPIAAADEVLFGIYRQSSIHEMAIRWYRHGREPLVARLEAFADSWVMLTELAEVFSALQHLAHTPITPEQVCDLLRSHGFVDRTPRQEARLASKAMKDIDHG